MRVSLVALSYLMVWLRLYNGDIMGTELISHDDAGNVYMKRFWGGEDRGVMYCLFEKNRHSHHVDFSKNDLLRICSAFMVSIIEGDDE